MRILIVEDEPVIARRLERLSREILGERISAVSTAINLQDARKLLASSPVDLVFLDLNLRGEDGFNLLKTAVAGSFHTVVVSAHTDEAVRAFEYGILDFIGKPFSRERLEKSFERLLHAREHGPHAARYLAVKKMGQIELVRIDDVLYVQGAGAYSELHLRDGSVLLHDKSLDKLLSVLPASFERIHRSYLVSLSEVRRLVIHEGTRYEAELRDGTILPVGRTRYVLIKEKVGGA